MNILSNNNYRKIAIFKIIKFTCFTIVACFAKSQYYFGIFVSNRFEMILMLIFLSIAALDTCFGSEEYLATALFYTDQYSRILLVTGPLPKATEEIIRRDLNGSINPDIPLKIAALYETVDATPVNPNVLYSIKKKYKSLHVASISRENSLLILDNMRINLNKQVLQKLESKKETVPDEDIYKGRRSLILKAFDGKRIVQAPKNFIPSDLYYVIEKKCFDCDQKSSLWNLIFKK